MRYNPRRDSIQLIRDTSVVFSTQAQLNPPTVPLPSHYEFHKRKLACDIEPAIPASAPDISLSFRTKMVGGDLTMPTITTTSGFYQLRELDFSRKYLCFFLFEVASAMTWSFACAVFGSDMVLVIG